MIFKKAQQASIHTGKHPRIRVVLERDVSHLLHPREWVSTKPFRLATH